MLCIFVDILLCALLLIKMPRRSQSPVVGAVTRGPPSSILHPVAAQQQIKGIFSRYHHNNCQVRQTCPILALIGNGKRMMCYILHQCFPYYQPLKLPRYRGPVLPPVHISVGAGTLCLQEE